MLITPEFTSQQILDFLMESQFWPQEKILEFQRENLTAVLHHAKANVPFYSTRLDCVLRADGTVDWDRWEEIPIVTRADLRDRGAEMTATSLPENDGHLGSASSSGSTGVPITHHISKLSKLVADQGWMRFFRIHNISLDDNWVEFRFNSPDGKPWETDITKIPRSGSSTPLNIINKTLPAAKKVQLLASVDPVYLVELSNHAEIIARENLRQGKPVKLKGVIAISMALNPEQQKLIAESFGAWSLSPYSSKEGGLMAFSCKPSPSHYHVNQEVNYFEVTDKFGRSCKIGEPGRTIITPLFNYLQPLIRYDQGDIAVRGKTCDCGRSSMVLQEISGRSDPIFRFPGKDFSLNAVNTAMVQNNLQADAFQIAQTEPSKLEVRYVSQLDAPLPNQLIVGEHLKKMIELDITISFVRVAEIPYNKGGKQQRMVREFDL